MGKTETMEKIRYFRRKHKAELARDERLEKIFGDDTDIGSLTQYYKDIIDKLEAGE